MVPAAVLLGRWQDIMSTASSSTFSMGHGVLTLGSLEPSYAILHIFFCTGQQNLALSVDAHNTLWAVYRGLAHIRDSLGEQRECWKVIQSRAANLQLCVEQARQCGYLSSAVLATLPGKTVLPPADLAKLFAIVDSIDLLVNSTSWNVSVFQSVVPLEVCLSMQHLPRDVILFRQQLHYHSDEATKLLVRIESLNQELSVIQQNWQSQPKQEKSNETPGSSDTLPSTVQAVKTSTAEEQCNADLFVEEMSKYGKLMKSSGFIKGADAGRIIQGLSSASLPSRLDLSRVVTESLLVLRGLVLTLAVKESTKDLTIPPLSPPDLQILADCFRTGQLEHLEVKLADEDPADYETFRGVGVKNAFASLGRIATVSFSLFLYQERYDCTDVLFGLDSGFSKLATKPSFRLALSLNSDSVSVAVEDALLHTDIVTEIFLDAKELNDPVCGAICQMVQSRSLRKLYICDAVLLRIRNESLLQSLINSFDGTNLELLVLGGLSCYEDPTGLDFLDAVFRSLASTCPIKHFWLNFADRAGGIQRQRKFIEHLSGMKALRSFTGDYYPETAEEIRKGVQGIELRWNKVPKAEGEVSSTRRNSEASPNDTARE